MKTHLKLLLLLFAAGFHGFWTPSAAQERKRNRVREDCSGRIHDGVLHRRFECNPDEKPRHRVQITKGFELGKYEITQAQWVAATQSNPSGGKGDNRPVENISKFEAQEFIAKLNAKNDVSLPPYPPKWNGNMWRARGNAAHSGPLDRWPGIATNSEDEHIPSDKRNRTRGAFMTSREEV